MSTSTTPAWPVRQDAALIGLVSTAHCISHFSQLLLAPLFPWLKTEFGVSYTELGLLMTIFFAVSCTVQALSGFVVDRFGPRPVLFGGMALLATAAFGFASSGSYAMLALFSVVAGIGNGVFHPVDYSLLNRRVHSTRLGHAYSAHGISGSLGWAAAPALLVPITVLASWRTALVVAGLLALLVLGLLVVFRRHLTLEMTSAGRPAATPASGSSFGFLAIPAVWMCFWFFLLSAIVLSGMQAFSTQAASLLHAVPTQLAAMCLTVYMLASASGMVVGGFLAANPDRCERVVGCAFAVAALFALALGFATVAALLVPVLFAGMGIAMGIASPSRDLLVKRSSPDNATGRVYGVVYSGLDIGQALAPLAFGRLMDMQRPQDVWLGIAIVQALMIVSAFNIHRVRRTPLSTAVA
jgi:MFS transporter, FSR family, fosmidomycin resistance protein